MAKVIFEDRKRIEEIASGGDLECYHYYSAVECNHCIINHFILDNKTGGTCKEIAKELLKLLDNQKDGEKKNDNNGKG